MKKPTHAVGDRRIITVQNGRKLLTVSSADDLKVISSPQRQRIFKILQTAGRPLHGKEIADCLGIKAPSAHFHLGKLKQIGAVKISYTQIINGITACYYEPAVDGIIPGEDFLESSDDEHIREKLLFAANTFNEAKYSFMKNLRIKMQKETSEPAINGLAAMVNEILYLSDTDTKIFYEDMESLLKKYTGFSSEKQPYFLFFSISKAEQT